MVMPIGGLKRICDPYRGILSRLLEALLTRLGERLVSVVVFGSVARCEAGPESDIDVLIVVKDLPRSRFRRQDLFMEIEEELQKDVEVLEAAGYRVEFSPILKTPEEASRFTPLYLDMVYDAVILYDKDNFFLSVLERLKRRLEELGAERVKVGRKWYWRLKKDYRFGEVIEIE